MPELPDVEVFRRYFDITSLYQEIAAVEVRESRLCKNIEEKRLNNLLRDREFTGSERHGKHLFTHVSSNGWVMLHFGMTGFLKYYKHSEEEPPHARVIFEFTNGYHLAYDNMRKLGWIDYTDSVDDFVSEQNLGPDALKLSQEEFVALFPEKRSMIKGALMHQQFIAGLGNIYTDEVLFQSGIHPRVPVNDLTDSDLENMFDTMQDIMDTAIHCKVEVSKFPPDYLIHVRDEGSECPRCGNPIQKIKVASRSTYYCEHCQPA